MEFNFLQTSPPLIFKWDSPYIYSTMYLDFFCTFISEAYMLSNNYCAVWDFNAEGQSMTMMGCFFIVWQRNWPDLRTAYCQCVRACVRA